MQDPSGWHWLFTVRFDPAHGDPTCFKFTTHVPLYGMQVPCSWQSLVGAHVTLFNVQ